MNSFYYDSESDYILTLNDIDEQRKEFNPEMSLEQYIEYCMNYNNGSLRTIPEQIAKEERQLAILEEEIRQQREWIDILKGRVDK